MEEQASEESDEKEVGHIGETGACSSAMAWVLLHAGEVRDNVEADSINVEKCVKEIAALVADLTEASGRMLEQEHLRMINMVSAINPGSSGGTGGNRFAAKRIMEHKVIVNLRMVNGDNPCSAKGTRGLSVRWVRWAEHVEIIQQLARERDLGRELDKVVVNLRSNYGEEFGRVSGDVWNIL